MILRKLNVRPIIIVLFATLALAGCAHELGYGGAHPGAISCKGKGTLTFMGGAIASAGLGGTEQNSGSVTADCGDGLTIIQGTPEQVEPTTPTPPKSATKADTPKAAP